MKRPAQHGQIAFWQQRKFVEMCVAGATLPEYSLARGSKTGIARFFGG